MNNVLKNSQTFAYVQIDEELCNGCVLCMKACPTKAIRVKDNGVARIQGICIDCGECVRVCPRGAVKPIFVQSDEIEKDIFSIVSSSAVLYSQFGGDVMPNEWVSTLYMIKAIRTRYSMLLLSCISKRTVKNPTHHGR